MADAATQSIEVNASAETFFDLITDYEALPTILANIGLTASHIDEDKGTEKTVTQTVRKMGTNVTYTLRYQLDRPRKVTWSLVKGQLMSKNEGTWLIEALDEKRCRVTYSIEMRFGLLVPKTVIKLLASKELPEMLATYKKAAEAKG